MWKNLVLKVENVILCNPTRSRPFMTCIESCLVASAQETWPWPNPGMPKHRNIGGSLTSERVLAPFKGDLGWLLIAKKHRCPTNPRLNNLLQAAIRSEGIQAIRPWYDRAINVSGMPDEALKENLKLYLNCSFATLSI